jgi:hypothetical protein
MNLTRFNTLALTTLAAGTLITGTASAATPSLTPRMPATFVAYETGYGPTLSSAEFAARQQFSSDYYGCGAAVLVSDAQHADGSWEATMAANCRGYV